MKPIARMTLGELAAFIQSHFRKKGVEVVLTGGSAVSMHSQGKYVSKDLDFVVHGFARRSKVRDAMGDLGFQEVGRHFEHPEVPFLVAFPGGPLSVGKQQVGKIEEREFGTGILKIISSTDCVKDRLAAYYYWNDRQALEQAIMVAHGYNVDLDEIANWSKNEGMLPVFTEIEGLLRIKED